MKVFTKVLVSKFAEKQIRKLPGYHDEPLVGKRKGQRSVRLNKAYRAIYTETISEIEVTVIEVNKHEY